MQENTALPLVQPIRALCLLTVETDEQSIDTSVIIHVDSEERKNFALLVAAHTFIDTNYYDADRGGFMSSLNNTCVIPRDVKIISQAQEQVLVECLGTRVWSSPDEASDDLSLITQLLTLSHINLNDLK